MLFANIIKTLKYTTFKAKISLAKHKIEFSKSVDIVKEKRDAVFEYAI